MTKEDVDAAAMPADMWSRCLRLRKVSKRHGSLSLSREEFMFLQHCQLDYPEEYAAMGAQVFQETKPFGSR